MLLAKWSDMVRALASNQPDHALALPVLPGALSGPAMTRHKPSSRKERAGNLLGHKFDIPQRRPLKTHR